MPQPYTNYGPCPNDGPCSNDGPCPNYWSYPNKCEPSKNGPPPDQVLKEQSDSYFITNRPHSLGPKLPAYTEQMFSDNLNSPSLASGDSRSRFSRYYEYRLNVSRVAQRDREPSRIPVNQLVRLLQKQRKLRKVIRKYIKKNVASSSKIHRFTYGFSYERQKLMKQDISFTPQVPKIIKKSHFPYNVQIKNKDLHAVYLHWRKKQKMLKRHYETKPRTCKLNNTFHNTGSYKSLHHRISCCKLKLCTDIEKNPGPTYIR